MLDYQKGPLMVKLKMAETQWGGKYQNSNSETRMVQMEKPSMRRQVNAVYLRDKWKREFRSREEQKNFETILNDIKNVPGDPDGGDRGNEAKETIEKTVPKNFPE